MQRIHSFQIYPEHKQADRPTNSTQKHNYLLEQIIKRKPMNILLNKTDTIILYPVKAEKKKGFCGSLLSKKRDIIFLDLRGETPFDVKLVTETYKPNLLGFVLNIEHESFY